MRLLDRLLDAATAVIPPLLLPSMVIYGSAPMVFAGLKADVSFDLDLFTSEASYEALRAAGFVEDADEWGFARLLVADAVEVVRSWPGVSYAEVLAGASVRAGSRGLAVASLEHVLVFKRLSRREKDQREAAQIAGALGLGEG